MMRLSQLIAQAQQTLEAQGDLEVWVRTSALEYDHTNTQTDAASTARADTIPTWDRSKQQRVFLIEGD